MFVGHYGVAFAARGMEKRVPLWAYCIAVQWVDILWTVLVYFGVERVHIQPGVNPSGPLVFDFYPYTHSLVAAVGWAGAAFVLYRVLTRYQGSQRPALFLALAVASHWFLDLIVHQPDLPVTDESWKVGFGLWNNPMAELAVELALLFGGLWFYFRKSPALSMKLRIALVVLCILIAGVMVAGSFGPPPPSVGVVAMSGFVIYLVFAAITFWIEPKTGS